MTFFYSSVGILLFSSIVLVNRFIVLFSNNTFENIESSYIGSDYQQIDKFFLKLINDGNDYGERIELCNNLKKELNYSGFARSKNFEYISYGITNSKHQDLVNSCILSEGSHRILVKKTNNFPIQYIFNSCLLKKEVTCPFEIGDL